MMASPSRDLESSTPNQLEANIADGVEPFFGFPMDFPYEFDSESSPANVPELTGEDEFLFDFTYLIQQLSLSSQKTAVQQGSPESTLDGLGSSRFMSRTTSPDGSFSPPATLLPTDTWSLIHAAADQVLQMKRRNDVDVHESQFSSHGGLLTGLEYSTPVASFGSSDSRFSSASSYNKNCEHQYLKQEIVNFGSDQTTLQEKLSMLPQKQQIHGGRRCSLKPHVAPPSPTPLQNATQIATARAKKVYNSLTGKSECHGTGVFFPRSYNLPQVSKRSGCSTVMLPAKVVQALNLKVDDLYQSGCHRQSSSFHGLSLDFDVLTARRNALLAQQKKIRNSRKDRHRNEFSLPPEWTY